MKVVKIQWLDSLSDDTSWHLVEENRDFAPLEITTLGFVIKETEDFVVIAQNYGKEIPQYCHSIIIPKCSIKSIQILEGGEK